MFANGGQESVDLEPRRVGEPFVHCTHQERDGSVREPLAQLLEGRWLGSRCELVEPPGAPREGAAKLVKVVGSSACRRCVRAASI